MKKIILSFLILFCIGCLNKRKNLPSSLNDVEELTVYSSDVQPRFDIELTSEKTFGDTDNILIDDLRDVVVDDKGRVYIADGEQLRINVYEPKGRFITQLGRKGEGPNEFKSLKHLQIAGQKILAYDSNQERAVVFSLDSLKHIYTIILAKNRNEIKTLEGTNLTNYYAKKKNKSLVKFISSGILQDQKKWETYIDTEYFYELNKEGTIDSKKILELKSSKGLLIPFGPRTIGRPVDFFGKSLRKLSNNGNIYTTQAPHFLVKIYNEKGLYQRAFYYPFERVPITLENAAEQGVSEHIRNNMSNIELPPNWPAINSMLIDDENRIWVSTIVKNMSVYEWWVLSNDGELLAQFTWPRSKTVEEVKNGKLYVLQEHVETGVKKIMRYDISLNAN